MNNNNQIPNSGPSNRPSSSHSGEGSSNNLPEADISNGLYRDDPENSSFEDLSMNAALGIDSSE